MDNLSQAGFILKEERLRRKVSLDAVHEATKIPIDALKALEEGYTTRTMTSFYQKAFLKLYAQYLNVDIKEILKEIKIMPVAQPYESDIDQEISSSLASVVKEKKPLREAIIQAPPAVRPQIQREPFHLKEKLQNWFPRQRVMIILKVLIAVLGAFVILRIGGCIAHAIATRPKQPAPIKLKAPQNKEKAKLKKDKNQEKPTERVEKTVRVATEPKEKASVVPERKSTAIEPPQSMVSAVVPSIPLVPAPSSMTQTARVVPDSPVNATSLTEASATEPDIAEPKNVMLSLRAPKNSWLLVKVDGATVFQGVFNKGVTKTWFAEKEIELSGKNISQLEYEVNGKMIGALGKEGRRAKTVLITQSGLAVKK